jgi:hypothetical protein
MPLAESRATISDIARDHEDELTKSNPSAEGQSNVRLNGSATNIFYRNKSPKKKCNPYQRGDSEIVYNLCCYDMVILSTAPMRDALCNLSVPISVCPLKQSAHTETGICRQFERSHAFLSGIVFRLYGRRLFIRIYPIKPLHIVRCWASSNKVFENVNL